MVILTLDNKMEDKEINQCNKEGDRIGYWDAKYFDLGISNQIVGPISFKGFYDDNNMKQGLWTEYYVDGSLFTHCDYRNDLPYGTRKVYYDLGYLSNSYYFGDDGIIEGERIDLGYDHKKEVSGPTGGLRKMLDNIAFTTINIIKTGVLYHKFE